MIRVLEKNVADKIAAGEVVERPVSVVKELVENSVDAGADSVVVEIRNGGKSYIRVTDNGCGIPREEAETAFLRHATSKIVSAKDLDAIKTLGFRGEALASIAAVTRTEFVSKTRDSKLGVRLLIHGSEVLQNSGTGCPDGTTVIVTDLFYNTPARRKFLKSDGAESGQIIDFMSQIALAYPGIKFRFINNGNIVFSTAGKGDVQAAISAVYKLREYSDLVPVCSSKGNHHVTGYISRPSLSRTNRKNQIFFVNGRVVSSKVIEKGLTEGYRERLFEGRYPVAFLFIETDPSELDVNIHPNKREVRFDRESEITELVAKAVTEALGTKEAVTEIRNPFRDPTRIEEEKLSENQVDIKQILTTKRRETSVKEEQPDYRCAENLSREENKEEEMLPSGMTRDLRCSNPEPQEESTVSFLNREEKESSLRPRIDISEPVLRPFDFSELTLTGVIFHTYITAEDENNFYLIDQHAAHERVFYEKLVAEYMSGEKPRQIILTPIIIEVLPAVKETEYDWLDTLTDMGFLVEEFGHNSYVVKEIPAFMTISESENFVKEFVDSLSEGIKLMNTVVLNRLITRSCKSAVKAHDHLSMEEMKSLLSQLSACRNPFSCPHGRPTFIRFSQYEIEKMFKRV